MEIEKHLPFECCDTCGEFIMKVQQKTLFYDGGSTHICLSVGCKYENKCVHLKRNLTKIGELNNED